MCGEHKDGGCCGGQGCSGGVTLISFKVTTTLSGGIFAIGAVVEDKWGSGLGTFIGRLAVAESPEGWQGIFTATPETHKDSCSLVRAFSFFLNKHKDRNLIFWGEGGDELELITKMEKGELVSHRPSLFLGKRNEKDPLCIDSVKETLGENRRNILSAPKATLHLFRLWGGMRLLV